MNFSHGKAKTAFRIAQHLRESHHTAYFAGGCVRDFLMNREAHDFDIATTAAPEEIERLFPHTIPVGKQFGVMLVVEDETPFEVATFRCEGGYVDGRHPGHVQFSVPEDDARRRDFTVNGLFYDPFENRVVDYVGGVQDIDRQVIRAIGDPLERFKEDKLRLLRAIRFASTLDFELEPKTWKALQQQAVKIHEVSVERVRDELIKMFTRPGAARGIELLSSSGLLKEILPEVEMMKGVLQQPEFHPEGDVYTHTKLLMEKLNHPSILLAFGALFHDVGKAKTYEVRKGKITFYQHAPIGAKITQEVMKRLRFSNEDIRGVSECVANHMKFADVQKMRTSKLKLFIARPHFEEELEMHRIDCQSSHGKLDNYYFLKKKLEEYSREELKPVPLINGHDLLALGMKAGPAIKDILNEVYELQLEGKFQSRDEAMEYCRNWIRGRNSGD